MWNHHCFGDTCPWFNCNPFSTNLYPHDSIYMLKHLFNIYKKHSKLVTNDITLYIPRNRKNIGYPQTSTPTNKNDLTVNILHKVITFIMAGYKTLTGTFEILMSFIKLGTVCKQQPNLSLKILFTFKPKSFKSWDNSLSFSLCGVSQVILLDLKMIKIVVNSQAYFKSFINDNN